LKLANFACPLPEPFASRFIETDELSPATFTITASLAIDEFVDTGRDGKRADLVTAITPVTIAEPGDELPLLGKGARRSEIFTLHPHAVRPLEAIHPIPLVAEVPAVINEQRVIGRAMTVIRKPGNDAEPFIPIRIEIAEVVMVIVRPHEEVRQQHLGLNHDRGLVDEGRLRDHRGREVHRSEQHSPIVECVVPIAVDEDAAVRRPGVMSRNPDPAGLCLGEISGTPHIIVTLPGPDAGNPEMIFRGGRLIRALFETGRRVRQIGQLFCILGGPESWNPFKSLTRFGPVSRNPLMPGRRDTPDSAHPDEPFLIDVPRPIAGDPDRVRGRHDLRRHFLNRIRWSLGDYDTLPFAEFVGDRLRECLVHRSIRQDLSLHRFGALRGDASIGPARWLLGTKLPSP